MLTELRVENLGIIAELRLVLGEGFTVITGETGAGKTLVVGAIEMLLGARADGGIVREGAGEARIEGRFVVGDDDVVLARVVPAEGRSRAYVDGRLAAISELVERGRSLVDLHGQHRHQSLLVPMAQRALLDRFAGGDAGSSRSALRAARAEVRRLDAELEKLGGDERARAREADLLRYQIAEIDAAALDDPGEEGALEREEALLADAEAHREALADARDRLSGPAVDALGAAAAGLARREPFEDLAERMRALQAEVSELAADVRVAEEGIVADPARLEEVAARRRELRELRRKYGDALTDVVAYAGTARARLAELDGHDARAADLAARQGAAERSARAAADRLSAARRAAAPALAAAVTTQLEALALPAAVFDVAMAPAEMGDDGADEITFVMAPNPGEPPRPVAKAASGGELSRAMLALRVVLSEAPPTLVFDEVDAGIGGEAGVAVGRALASLGGNHQVLCVTHLAQVAAFADAQVVVSKSEVAGRTVATASVVLDDARVGELSRMLAGDGASAHARRHAGELLAAAEQERRKVHRR